MILRRHLRLIISIFSALFLLIAVAGDSYARRGGWGGGWGGGYRTPNNNFRVQQPIPRTPSYVAPKGPAIPKANQSTYPKQGTLRSTTPKGINKNDTVAQIPSYHNRSTTSGLPIIAAKNGKTFSISQKGILSINVSLISGTARSSLINSTEYYKSAWKGISKSLESASRSAKLPGKSRQFNPMTRKGPLKEGIVATFRSGTYTETTLSRDIILYRVYGGDAGKVGSYLISKKPTGPLSAIMGSAISQQGYRDYSGSVNTQGRAITRNSAERIVAIRVPRGTRIYSGHAAQQDGLVGGEEQIYIESVSKHWEIDGE